MEFHEVEIDITVDGEHHADASMFVTAILAQTLGLLEDDKPAAASTVMFRVGRFEQPVGVITVRDQQTYETLVLALDAIYGRHHSGVDGLRDKIQALLGIKPEEDKDPPLDPRRN